MPQFGSAAQFGGVSSGLVHQAGTSLCGQSATVQHVSGDAMPPAFQRRLSHMTALPAAGVHQGRGLSDPPSFGMSPLQHLSNAARGDVLHPTQQLLSPKSLAAYGVRPRTSSILEQHLRPSQQSVVSNSYAQSVGRLPDQKDAQIFSRHQVIVEEQRRSPQRQQNHAFSQTGFNAPQFGCSAFSPDLLGNMRLTSSGTLQHQSSLTHHKEKYKNTQPLTHKNDRQAQVVLKADSKFNELLR